MRRTISCGCWMLLALVSIGVAGRDVPLIEAAKQADLKAMRELLQGQGDVGDVDVNVAEADGTTALHWAVHHNDLDEAVELLIARGANVNAANRYGVTPLALACMNGSEAAIVRLLKAGADPNASRVGGETALMTASRAGNVEGVRVLLVAGADVNAREATRGQTALMWAADQGNAGVIKGLVEHGADLHARSRGPASAEERPEATRVYQRNYARTGRMDSFTPLLFAVRAGHLDAVEVLLEAGANVNDTVEDGTSALVLAAVNAHWEVGAFLLDNGADPNIADQGWTALHQIVRTRTLNIGQFPHPVPTGRLSSVEFTKKLIAHGADVNARMTVQRMRDGFRSRFNGLQATPFLLAAKGADAEMMRLLAANGADLLPTNAAGSTALMLAAGVEMLFVAEDSGTNEDALEAVRVALELGGDVNAVNESGDTALHGVASRGSNPIVQLLADNGAKLDAKNKKGFTALDIASGAAAFSGGVVEVRPATQALLRQLMKERGLSIDEASLPVAVSRGKP